MNALRPPKKMAPKEDPADRMVLTCALCLGKLENKTVILGCHHKHCHDCSQKLFGPKLSDWRIGHNSKVICPICNTATTIEDVKVGTDTCEFREKTKARLPTSGFYDKETGIHGLACGQCEAKMAKVECKQCAEFFCPDCCEMVHEKGRMKLHKIIHITTSMSLNDAIFNSGMCHAHPEEQVMYYCLDCESQCICTECVVHGDHRDHEVMTLRKAAPLVKTKARNSMKKLIERLEELAIAKQKVEQHGKELSKNTASIKKTMAHSFAEVRERLRKKEEELMHNADFFLEEQQAMVDECISSADDEIYRFSSALKALEMYGEGQNEQAIINFFAHNKELFKDLSLPVPDMVAAFTNVSNRKAFMSMEATNRQIEALHGLHLVIASLKNPLEAKEEKKEKCAIFGCINEGVFLCGDRDPKGGKSRHICEEHLREAQQR